MLQRQPDLYRGAKLINLPMEGDMNITLSNLDTSELFGKIFKIGFTVYAVALLARVIQGFTLV